MTEEIINAIENMKNSSIRNYIVPGLTSSLIGGKGFGKIRLFEMSRLQHMPIHPHSHCYDFTCIVLQGCVTNKIWGKCEKGREYEGDIYRPVREEGGLGDYKRISTGEDDFYSYDEVDYHVGEVYSMTHDQIHSIDFSSDAIVLFFEGPEVKKYHTSLIPVVDGQVIEPACDAAWQFLKD